MTAYCEEFYCLDNADTVLANFRSYRYVANANETVEKIDTDKKNFPCVKVCIATAYQ